MNHETGKGSTDEVTARGFTPHCSGPDQNQGKESNDFSSTHPSIPGVVITANGLTVCIPRSDRWPLAELLDILRPEA